MTDPTNPAAHLDLWLREAKEYADRAAVEAKRGGNRPRTEPQRIREVWCLIWELDEEDRDEKIECYRRGMAMIETGQEVRRRARAPASSCFSRSGAV